MKAILFSFFLFLLLPLQQLQAQQEASAQRVVLVTFDGFRWQELFQGPHLRLLKRKRIFKTDPAISKQNYYDENAALSRAKLLPFIWNEIAKNGLILGNRKLGNKMDVCNPFRFSYPGYSEIFSGYVDKKINSNSYPENPNLGLFDALQADSNFHAKTAAFATWDAFPNIINTKRNGTPVYVNFKTLDNGASCNDYTVNKWQTSIPPSLPLVKTDTMTYHLAKEYVYEKHPSFVFIGFDETDDFAHEGHYDAYLNAAHQLDAFMADLWSFLQKDEYYRGKTTLILTCDHGRGRDHFNWWRHHGKLLPEASQIWMAAMGPGIPAVGEQKSKAKLYQKQIAATVAQLLHIKNYPTSAMGKAIRLN